MAATVECSCERRREDTGRRAGRVGVGRYRGRRRVFGVVVRVIVGDSGFRVYRGVLREAGGQGFGGTGRGAGGARRRGDRRSSFRARGFGGGAYRRAWARVGEDRRYFLGVHRNEDLPARRLGDLPDQHRFIRCVASGHLDLRLSGRRSLDQSAGVTFYFLADSAAPSPKTSPSPGSSPEERETPAPSSWRSCW